MTCALIRREDEDTDKYRGKTIRRHREEKTGIHKPSRDASAKTNPADTLILDF